MEGTTNLLRQHKRDLDRGISDVMPDGSAPHARLAIRESDAVPESMEDEVIERALELAEEKDYTPEKVANSLIKHIADKMD